MSVVNPFAKLMIELGAKLVDAIPVIVGAASGAQINLMIKIDMPFQRQRKKRAKMVTITGFDNKALLVSIIPRIAINIIIKRFRGIVFQFHV